MWQISRGITKAVDWLVGSLEKGTCALPSFPYGEISGSLLHWRWQCKSRMSSAWELGSEVYEQLVMIIVLDNNQIKDDRNCVWFWYNVSCIPGTMRLVNKLWTLELRNLRWYQLIRTGYDQWTRLGTIDCCGFMAWGIRRFQSAALFCVQNRNLCYQWLSICTLDLSCNTWSALPLC